MQRGASYQPGTDGDVPCGRRVILSVLDEGTGVVHIAPAFGEDDFKIGASEELYFVQHVDLQGNMIGNFPFAGKFVKDADSDIIDDLTARELLFRHTQIVHTYPFCWRCSSPLVYYAKSSWYINTTAIKETRFWTTMTR